MTVNSILRITDGTTSVTLLGVSSGVLLNDWQPAMSEPKGGGIFRDSPLTDGRVPEFRKFGNVIETFDVKLHAFSQDRIASNLRDLRRLLEQAVTYWTTSYATNMVWLEVQGPYETIKRHALVYDYRTPAENNPFAQPLFAACRAAMDGFTLLIEREPFWRYEEPGTTKPIAASAVEAYDSRNLGNVDGAGARQAITTPHVFMANKRNTANVTTVFQDDGGAFSANLMDAALPYSLLPAIPAVNDAVYFGSRTALVNPAPFCSLVFDVGTPATNVTITWECWTGAAWAAFTAAQLHDNTAGFSVAGINSVSWFQNALWASNTVNGVAAFWVRARVSAVGASPTGATQQNRDVYSVTWPYIEVQADQLLGDRPSLLRLRIRNHSCRETDPSDIGIPALYSDKLTIGARRVSRGENFTAFLNFSDTQNPTGFTAADTGAQVAFTDDIRYAATGRMAMWSPTTAIAGLTLARITLDNTISSDYTGRFHAYIRARHTGGSQNFDFSMALRVQVNDVSSTLLHQSAYVGVASGNLVPPLYDMGVVELPPGGVDQAETIESLIFTVLGTWNAAVVGSELRLYELILIPVDEWAGEAEKGRVTGLWGRILFQDNYLELDSAVYSRRKIYSPVRNRSSDNLEVTYVPMSADAIQISPEERIRLWMVTQGELSFAVGSGGYPFVLHSMSIEAVQRYDSMIGDDGS